MKKIILSVVIMIVISFTISCTTTPATTDVLPESITIASDNNETSLDINGNLFLTATVLPANATVKDVVWSSSNILVATVYNGLVTGVSDGEVTITVTSKANSQVKSTIDLVVTNLVVDIKDSYGNFSIDTEVVDGYTISDNVYTFTKSGDYTLSGLLVGGLVFSSTLNTKVTLKLNNVYIENPNGPAVYWTSENSKVVLESCEGSINYLLEGNYESLNSSGAINSENNIEILGSGVLNIGSEFKHAIKGSDVTIGEEVVLHIFAQGDGIHAKTVTISGGTIFLNNCSDAIQAEVNSKGNKGTVVITSGTLYINNCEKGIKVDTSLTINGATVSIEMTNISDEGFSYPTGGLSLIEGVVLLDGQNYS